VLKVKVPSPFPPAPPPSNIHALSRVQCTHTPKVKGSCQAEEQRGAGGLGG